MSIECDRNGSPGSSGGSCFSSNDCNTISSDSGSDLMMAIPKGDDSCTSKKGTNKYRAYHKEIERKRRTRIRDSIKDLANIVPHCKGLSDRLDKLTVLKMAVQHFRLLSEESDDRDALLGSPKIGKNELKRIIEDSSGGCLVVVRCDDLRLIYISENVQQLLPYTPSDLVGCNLCDCVAPSDVMLVKRQLLLFPLSNYRRPDFVNSEPTADEGTGKGCPSGSKRYFYCRLIKPSVVNSSPCHRPTTAMLDQIAAPSDSVTVHFSGSIRCSSSISQMLDDADFDEADSIPYFIGVCRPIQQTLHDKPQTPCGVNCPPTNKFISYHSADAKYLRVDSVVAMVIGYLPQEIIGRCMYEFIHPEDHVIVANIFKNARNANNISVKGVSDVFRMKSKNGDLLAIRASCSCFINPYSNQMEFIVLENTIVSSKSHELVSCYAQPGYDLNSTSQMKDQKREDAIPRKRPLLECSWRS